MKIVNILILTGLVNLSLNAQQQVEIQGHRGARGLYPENTLEAFAAAQKMGVDVLELDVVISKDRQIVVSHEPWLSASICMDTSGSIINRSKEKNWNLYQMNYDAIKKANCGIKPHSGFPEQQKMNTYKPLLKEVIRQSESWSEANKSKKPVYNIEIKSSAEGDDIYHPKPEEFSKLVYDFLASTSVPWERITIQSFDFRVLQYWNEHYPEVKLVALVENTKSIDDNLEALGFLPAIYSPYFKLINQSSVDYLHEKGIKVIPWTINEVEDMKRLIAMGVDGIITDYPNRALAIRP